MSKFKFITTDLIIFITIFFNIYNKPDFCKVHGVQKRISFMSYQFCHYK